MVGAHSVVNHKLSSKHESLEKGHKSESSRFASPERVPIEGVVGWCDGAG